MDIFEELKDLVLQNGLKTWIENYRNPKNESFYNTLLCDVKYDPKTDSRIYQYDEGHPGYNPFTDGEVIVSIDDALKQHLHGRCINFEKQNQNLLFLVIDDFHLLEKVVASAPDFSYLRKKAKQISPVPSIANLLIIHIGKIERLYKEFHETALRNNRVASVPKKDKVISFGYIGDKEFLRFLYYGFKLEKGNFIDKDKTPFDVFVQILSSSNTKEEAGLIHFDCETTQATYILIKLKDYFKNLTFTAIQQSDKFRSKQNTPIKADSLSKYKSATSAVKEQKDIDDQFKSWLKTK